MPHSSPPIDRDDVDLVVFDCDGVLIDSEIISNRVDVEELTRIGYETTAEDLVKRFTGVPYTDMFAAIEAEMQRPFPDGFVDGINARIHDLYQTDLVAIDGIESLLRRLTLPKCVASSTHMPKLRMSLDLTGLLDHFDPHVFSVTQVARGKPAPDLFLFAAETMGAAPARCLVIEDSRAGVAAGVAAGMPVIGFTGAGHSYPGHAEALAEAGALATFGHMDEIAALLNG